MSWSKNVISKILGRPKSRDVWSKNNFVPKRIPVLPLKKGQTGDFYYLKKTVTDKETGMEKEVQIPVPIRNVGPKAAKPEELFNIAASPFLTREEKIEQMRRLGASQSGISTAFMRANDQRNRRRVHGRYR